MLRPGDADNTLFCYQGSPHLTQCSHILSLLDWGRVQTEKDFRTLLHRAKAAWYGSDEVRELDGAMKDRFGSCVVDDEAHSIRSPETKSNDCLAILNAGVYLLICTTVFPNVGKAS